MDYSGAEGLRLADVLTRARETDGLTSSACELSQ
jgi:hypothetical protein